MNNLLNNLIKFGKLFSRLTQIGQFAVIIALVTVAFSVGSCEGKDKLDKFIVEYESFKRSAEVTTQYADSLKKEVVQLTDSAQKKDETIKKLTISVSFREQQRNSLKNQLTGLESRIEQARLDSNLTVVVATQDTAIANLKNQVQVTDSIVSDQKQIIRTKDEQLTLISTALSLSNQRGDSLQTVLSSIPKPPSNPNKWFGFIPKPSRTVVGVVSLAAGVIIGSKF